MIKRIVLVGTVLAAILGLAATNAWGYWTVSPSAAHGPAASGSLAAPVVTATSTVAGQASISWSAPSSAHSYTVSRTPSGGNATPVCGTGTTPLTTTSCTDTGVTAGTYTYSVTATSYTWTSTGTSSNVTVTAVQPTQLVFSTEPSGTASGGTVFVTQPKVSVQNASGTITTNTDAITLSIFSGTGTLVCTANPVNAVAGVATFGGCSLDKAGTYKLQASDGSLTVSSTSIMVSAATAAKLVFTTSPTDSFAGWAFYSQPVVTVEDAGGNTVTGSSAAITLKITTGTGTAGAALSCTTNPQNASSGVDTFAGCQINTVGSAYTLTATSGPLTSAVSTSFNVVAAPTHLAWTMYSASCGSGPSGTSFSLTYGQCGNGIFAADVFTTHITLTDSSGHPIVNLGPDLPVTLSLTGVSGGATTIPHGQSTTGSASTFQPSALLYVTATGTAAASGVTSATVVLNAF